MVTELRDVSFLVLSPESENSTHAVKKTNPKGEEKKKKSIHKGKFLLTNAGVG